MPPPIDDSEAAEVGFLRTVRGAAARPHGVPRLPARESGTESRRTRKMCAIRRPTPRKSWKRAPCTGRASPIRPPGGRGDGPRAAGARNRPPGIARAKRQPCSCAAGYVERRVAGGASWKRHGRRSTTSTQFAADRPCANHGCGHLPRSAHPHPHAGDRGWRGGGADSPCGILLSKVQNWFMMDSFERRNMHKRLLGVALMLTFTDGSRMCSTLRARNTITSWSSRWSTRSAANVLHRLFAIPESVKSLNN